MTREDAVEARAEAKCIDASMSTRGVMLMNSRHDYRELSPSLSLVGAVDRACISSWCELRSLLSAFLLLQQQPAARCGRRTIETRHADGRRDGARETRAGYTCT
jgi:hypothetical protein